MKNIKLQERAAVTLAEVIGDDLCIARMRAGLTLDQVAQRMGSHRPVVARLESGIHVPKLVILIRYADALNISVVDLIGSAMEYWEGLDREKRL